MKLFYFITFFLIGLFNNNISSGQSIKFCVYSNNNGTTINNRKCLVEAYYALPVKNVIQSLCALNDTKLSILTIQENTIKNDKLLSTMCAEGGVIGALSWLPWNDYIEFIKPTFNLTDELPLVIRNSLLGGSTNNLTPYSVADDDNNSTSTTAATLKYNEFVEVLLERLPIGYALKNITSVSWRNNTYVKDEILGYATLTNNGSSTKYVHNEIEYGYEGIQKIKFNNINLLADLPKIVYDDNHDETLVRNFPFDNRRNYTGVDINFIAKAMTSFTQMNVTLIGSWSHVYYEIEGDIQLLFDLASIPLKDTFEYGTFKAQMIETKITNVSHIFDEPIQLIAIDDVDPIIVVDVPPPSTTATSETPTTIEIGIPIDFIEYPAIDNDPDSTLLGLARPTEWYPGFYKYFVAACIILSLLITIVTFDVVRRLIRDRRIRKNKTNFNNYMNK